VLEAMRLINRFLANYQERHLDNINRLLHLIGLPLTFVVPIVFLTRQEWWLAVGCFIGGYTLQFMGHFFEGNDAGELILIKRSLGMSAIEFGPKHPSHQPSSDAD
jgi:hypothetical protein